MIGIFPSPISRRAKCDKNEEFPFAIMAQKGGPFLLVGNVEEILDDISPSGEDPFQT